MLPSKNFLTFVGLSGMSLRFSTVTKHSLPIKSAYTQAPPPISPINLFSLTEQPHLLTNPNFYVLPQQFYLKVLECTVVFLTVYFYAFQAFISFYT